MPAVRADLVFDIAATIAPGGNLPPTSWHAANRTPRACQRLWSWHRITTRLIGARQSYGFPPKSLEAILSIKGQRGASWGGARCVVAFDANANEPPRGFRYDCVVIKCGTYTESFRRLFGSGSLESHTQASTAPEPKPLLWLDEIRVIECGAVCRATFEEIAARGLQPC